jgi:hypothetical protein
MRIKKPNIGYAANGLRHLPGISVFATPRSAVRYWMFTCSPTVHKRMRQAALA